MGKINLIPRREDFLWPFEQTFNNIVDEFFSKSTADSVRASGGFPRMDIVRDGDKLTLTVVAAGMESKDINIEISPEKVVTITGKMPPYASFSDEAVWHVRELRQSYFSRSVSLPENIVGDPDAVLKDGLLTLTWKLDVPQVQPVKRIEIKSE